MNFFRHLGQHEAESFKRRDGADRFMEIQTIGRGAQRDIAALSTQVANSICPEQSEEVDPSKSGFFDCIEYSVSEMMLNVVQHSRGVGYVGAQYYPNQDKTQIAIADTGIGIKNSFWEWGSPFRTRCTSDLEYLKLAVGPHVSCKTHQVDPFGGGCENAGVGLTMLRDIAHSCGGDFALVSGEGALLNDAEITFPKGHGYQGTFVSFSFCRSKMDKFGEYSEAARSHIEKSNGSNGTIAEIGEIFK